MTDRVGLPLPSHGRAGPTVVVPNGTTSSKFLEVYYHDRRSMGSLFERRVQPVEILLATSTRIVDPESNDGSMITITGGRRPPPRFLRELDSYTQYRVFINNLWGSNRYSKHFRRKVWSLTQLPGGKGLNTLQRWIHTADGAVLPLLLNFRGEVPWPTDFLEFVDKLTHFVLENCANNYAHFIKTLKSYKKKIRRNFAIGRELPKAPRSLRTYEEACRMLYAWAEETPVTEVFRIQTMMSVTQTRATGLADSRMARESFEKFRSTVSQIGRQVPMDGNLLGRLTSIGSQVSGFRAKISSGPSGCLEMSREDGGQTGFLSYLCRYDRVYNEYDLEDLTITPIPGGRRIRTSGDVLFWALDKVLNRDPEVVMLTRTVRVHVVKEPSKARVITVPSYVHMIIMQIFAHLWTPCLRDRAVISGLTSTDHLWNFLKKDLNNNDPIWESLRGPHIWALSSDLSEATDYGNISVARSILHGLIVSSMRVPGFPLGLAVLAKTMFLRSRPVLFNGRFSFLKRKGWLMGDPLCKLVLTISTLYVMRESDIRVGSLVGDDLLMLSGVRSSLTSYVQRLEALDFKVSYEDTYVSKRIMYFCEEISRVPQHSYECLDVVMRSSHLSLPYIDYPRLRLLLPTLPDTERSSYSHLGRFALLGKEAKWVHLNPACSLTIRKAVMLQHLCIPQPVEVICPCLPVEIGGDGSFPPSPEYLLSSIERSRWIGPEDTGPEITFRIRQLLSHTRGERYILTRRSTNLSLHRYAKIFPLYERFLSSGIFPENSILYGENQYHRNLLSCFPRTFQDPMVSFLRMAKSAYYREILHGRMPGELRFDLGRSFHGNRGDYHPLSLEEATTFMEMWQNPGFSFRNLLPYLIDEEKIIPYDYLNLGWHFAAHAPPDDTLEYLQSNQSLITRNTDMVLDVLRSGRTDFPEVVLRRLPLFMESDNLVLWQLENTEEKFDRVVLVSKDIRLGKEISLRYRCPVDVLDPVLWLVGRGYEIPTYESSHVVEDPGAIMYSDYTEFRDGIHITGRDVYDLEMFSTRKDRNGLVHFWTYVHPNGDQVYEYTPVDQTDPYLQ